MALRRRLAVMAILAGFALASSALAGSAPRRSQELAQGWRFHRGEIVGEPFASTFDDSGWQQVSLPHTWNRVGEYRMERSGATDNYQGASWYSLNLKTPAARPGERHFLQFDGVGTIADVWLNGHHLGQHRGGYSAFRFDVTPFVNRSGLNRLVVKADNSKPAPGSPTANVLPLSGDFFPYGGLYRCASWIVAPAVQVHLLDHGGPGVYLSTASAADKSATVRVLTRLRNFGDKARRVEVVTAVSDAGGVKATARSQAVATAGQGEVGQSIRIPSPHLWQGRNDPYLYKVTVELRAGGKVLDRVEQPLGIRTYRIDPDKGFFLNGRHVALHGVSRHQDRMGKGGALSDADHVQDMDLIEEMGANTIRFAHYQHAQKWFELADQRGMVVWAEIPYVSIAAFDDGKPAPETVQNAREQLTELIRQNYNHPSVAVWGIGNEVDSKVLFARKPVQARALLDELDALAKHEDPGRLTTLADCCAEAPVDGGAAAEVLVGAADTVGFNRYPGWCSPDASAMGAILDRLHRRFPAVPMSVSEYGAGAALSQHSDNPLGGPVNAFGRPHPEEFQGRVHEASWRALKDRPYLWATLAWNMFDFASDFRGEGDAIDLNDKGLVTFDRKVRKDAFYFYKANWSSAPVLHVNGRRYVDRPYPVADISAYSNAVSARLTVNGSDAGMQPCPDKVCTWRNVPLAPGANRIVATASLDGQALSDEIVLNGADPGKDGVRINVGDLTGALLPDSRRFGSDHFFSGGEAKALNSRSMTALFERRGAAKKVVAGAAAAVLHDGYREGRFTYDVPLADGNWLVKVTSFEPGEGAPGARTFSVIANGDKVLASFDPFVAAGGALKEAVAGFPVTVRGGHLLLAFEPETGPVVVSAIEIERR